MNIEAYSPHMLLDPKTTPSRLFVKNLPTSGLSKLELHEHFSQYGKVHMYIMHFNLQQ
jgi:RNA recognition motif-containing protein